MQSHELLRPLLSLIGRAVIPPKTVAELVGTGKQLAAYNLCDGTKKQSEVVEQVKIDSGNFSRIVTKWIEAGILFRIGEGREARLLHVYPISADVGKMSGEKLGQRTQAYDERIISRT